MRGQVGEASQGYDVAPLKETATGVQEYIESVGLHDDSQDTVHTKKLAFGGLHNAFEDLGRPEIAHNDCAQMPMPESAVTWRRGCMAAGGAGAAAASAAAAADLAEGNNEQTMKGSCSSCASSPHHHPHRYNPAVVTVSPQHTDCGGDDVPRNP